MSRAIKNGTKCAFEVESIISQNNKKINILNTQQITRQVLKDNLDKKVQNKKGRLHDVF